MVVFKIKIGDASGEGIFKYENGNLYIESHEANATCYLDILKHVINLIPLLTQSNVTNIEIEAE